MFIFKRQALINEKPPQVSTGNVFWLLWTSVSIAPWVLPTHSLPWRHFYSELLWVALSLTLLFWASIATKDSWQIGWPELFVSFVAFVPLAQGFAGMFLFPAEAWVIATYVLTFALALITGRRLYAFGSNTSYQAIDWLMAGLAIAAFISTGIALYQWWALDGLGLMVQSMEVGGTRAVGNMGQSNNLSTLIVWGLVAIWWAYTRQKIALTGVMMGAAFLLIGVALTGSRTGWIQIALLALLAVVFGAGETRRVRAICIIALLAWFVGLLIAIPLLSAEVWQSVPRTLGEVSSGGLRLKFWAMSLDAIWLKPWFGYGWNQTVLAQVALANSYPHLGEAMGHSHNVILDLLIWNGLPIGLFLIVISTQWFIRLVRRVQTEANYVLLSFVAVFLVHAMLELPHVYTYFLLPVGLVLGHLDAINSKPSVMRISPLLTGLASALALVATLLIFLDYGKTDTYLRARGMVVAHIYGAEMPMSPSMYILKPMQIVVERIHTDPKCYMTEQDLDELGKASLRYPTSGAPFRYAKAAAMNGRFDEVQRTLETICNMHPKDKCEAARQEVLDAQQEQVRCPAKAN